MQHRSTKIYKLLAGAPIIYCLPERGGGEVMVNILHLGIYSWWGSGGHFPESADLGPVRPTLSQHTVVEDC
jgi:hypothetical protein